MILTIPNLDSWCLLQPCKAVKLIKFKNSAALGEQILFSSMEEHCNPLFIFYFFLPNP